MVRVSVLICTYNRPTLLSQSLAALIERTEEKPEQVVVVNGGDERAFQVVEKYTSRQDIQVKLVHTINKNLAASRNVGLPHCTGDLVAMTDDDAEVFPDWVTEMKCVHAENPQAGAVGGPVIGTPRESLIARISDQVTFPAFSTARNVRTLPGVNVSYKRAAIEQVGAQDESLFRGEDVDYNWRVQKLGWRLWYDPRVRVLHYHRSSLPAFLHQHYMYGRAYYRVRRKWQEMYCVYPHSITRLRDFVKAANFFAAILYEPFIYAARMERILDKLLAYPILFANQIAWRGGMVRERLALGQMERAAGSVTPIA